ncbi:unnamed protein product [Lepeophtheirus salmonis]|uniref:(salmon louse) hypothetical protein n=1 Tax=Lepeophtheirus salmonis TaxID=72036 RepID=A0A7R8H901_LEPSM|nr:unnamed protein product [Lepeophtheirus salmonis]CAF2931667.1 unnamed protein product [Lepeophtheirus salmonis]
MMKLLAYLLLVGTTLALPYSTNLQESSSDTLIKVAEKLNLKTFVQKALGSDVSKIINHDGPFTVFLLQMTLLLLVNNNTQLNTHLMKPCYSISQELADDGRTIRFNVYNGGQVKTANGRRIMKTDNVARNGVVSRYWRSYVLYFQAL